MTWDEVNELFIAGVISGEQMAEYDTMYRERVRLGVALASLPVIEISTNSLTAETD